MINVENVLKRLGIEKLSDDIGVYEDGLIYFRPAYQIGISIETEYSIMKAGLSLDEFKGFLDLSWHDKFYKAFIQGFEEKFNEIGFEINNKRPSDCITGKENEEGATIWADLEFVKEVETEDECVESVKALLELIHSDVERDPNDNFIFVCDSLKYLPKYVRDGSVKIIDCREPEEKEQD